MKLFFNYLIVLILAFSAISVEAQVLTESAAREELARRGLADQEERIIFELKEQGIDLQNLNVNNPAEVQRAQSALESIIKKIENEKKAELGAEKSAADLKESSATDIKAIDDAEIIEAVKDGATVDEAVVEVLNDNQQEQLPPAETFGQHIFRSQSVKFYNKSEDAKAPSSYIIGPGDNVSISIWGISVYSKSFEVNESGYIMPFPNERIFVGGLDLAQAKDLIRSKMSRLVKFRNGDFDVNIVTARTININISGEVFNYGSFNVSALNNAFNALVVSGGPTDIGSVRKIQLRRAGEAPKTLDIYKFITDPLVGDDYYLKENDFINVPVAEKIVSIQGAINRPFKYELIGNEGLSDLIEFAGGLKDNALIQNIQVRRKSGNELDLIDIDYSQSRNTRFQLLDGDQVVIKTAETSIENTVTINGAVEVTGEFAYESGMRVSDLLKKSRLKENAITETVYLRRLNSDLVTVDYKIINVADILGNPGSTENIKLQRGDVLIVKSASQFAERYSFSVNGQVRNPSDFAMNEGAGLRISDAIFLSGGLTPDALMDYAYIFRKVSPTSKELEYVPVNLEQALTDPTSNANVLIQPNDRLVIYNKYSYKDEFNVSVSGKVHNPTKIKYDASLTLQDALRMSGGLKLESNPDRVNVYRLDFSDNKETKVLTATLKITSDLTVQGGEDFKLQPFDEIIVRSAPDFELLRKVMVFGEVTYPGEYVITKDNMRISDLLEDAGGLTEEAFVKGAKLYRTQNDIGYIIFDLDKALNDTESHNNLILQLGDRIVIPKLNDIVSIQGATNANELYNEEYIGGLQNFPFESGKNAKYYIDEYAGGFADNADKSRTTVEYPSGEIKKTKKFLFFKFYPEVKPGSKIKVVYKRNKEKKESKDQGESVDWGKVLSDSVAQATTVLTLILLIQRLD